MIPLLKGDVSRMSPFISLFHKPTTIQLAWENNHFQIKFFSNGLVTNFGEVFQEWSVLKPLSAYLDSNAINVEVPFEIFSRIREDLRQIRDCLGERNRLQIYIRDEAEKAVFLKTAPDDFVIEFKYAQGTLWRKLPVSVSEYEDGWFRRGNLFWHYPKLNATDLRSIRRNSINNDEILAFLTTDLHKYKEAGVAVECDLHYNPEHAVEFRFAEVGFSYVQIEPLWRLDPFKRYQDVTIEGHILVDGELSPSIDPEEVKDILPEVKEPHTLKINEIANFLEYYYPTWKNWFTGDIQQFEQIHHWITLPLRWILSIHHGKSRHPVGQPIACIGNERIDAQSLCIIHQNSYWHFPSGWIRSRELKELYHQCPADDIAQTEGVPITASQFLHHGDEALAKKWSGYYCNGDIIPNDPDIHLTASQHLQWLLKWGLNGGLSGGLLAFLVYGFPALKNEYVLNKNTQIMIIGSPYDLNAVRQYNDEQNHPLNYTARDYHAFLSERATLSKDTWDIQVLLEPDTVLQKEGRLKTQIIKVLSIRCKMRLLFTYQNAYELSEQDLDFAVEYVNINDKDDLQFFLRDIRSTVNLKLFEGFAHQETSCILYNGELKKQAAEDKTKVGSSQKTAVKIAALEDETRETIQEERAAPVPKPVSIKTNTEGEPNKGEKRVEIQNVPEPLTQIPDKEKQDNQGHYLPEDTDHQGISNNEMHESLVAQLSHHPVQEHNAPDEETYVMQKDAPADHLEEKTASALSSSGQIVPYLTTHPLFDEMDDQQKQSYSFLRSQWKKNVFPDHPYQAYILLYIYELINLNDVASEEESYP